MTLRDFNCLSEVGKDETVSFKGVYVKEHLIPGFRIILYRVDDFYVEVYLDSKEEKLKRYKGCVRSDILFS